MLEGLVFGWRTAVLLVAAVQLLAIAVALARSMVNRAANRTLAVLLLVMASMITPWIIGFAGFYDRWPWLTFAPFQISLAVAPLFWLYAVALVTGAWPRRGALHLIPAAVQLIYLCGCFLLPLEAKWAWSDRSDLAYGVLTGSALIAGFAWYGRISRDLISTYTAALVDHVGDDHRYAPRWLRNAMIGAAILFPIWAGYSIAGLFMPISYHAYMGLYLTIAGVALFLAIEGWRHAVLPFPRLADLATPAPAVSPGRDWQVQGETWAEAIRVGGWAAEPGLTLAQTARLLGTNSSHLSRALNDGLGVNFSTFINRLRAEAVAAAMVHQPGHTLLDLALAAGFSSKANFNRAFSERFGAAPSAWRARLTS
ncbi:helix-turn-helix domain-containing protein [Sphingomonas sp. FW199]|uniref:AraC family transcriptional regulator n=1 Tax=Sphingomonas sp. FW199 TaxID=3400217 RepID=UPI003CEA31D7